MEPDKVRGIIEAILLTADTPVSPGRLAALLDNLSGRDIRAAIDALNHQYQEADHAFTIIEIAGGFQLATRQEYGPWVREFHRERGPVRLSQAALETLAIVAFKQPVTRVQIEAIRGVNSDGVMHTLLEYNLIRIVGRSDGIGKPMLFGTTKDFLIHFGLKTLADLPKPQELEELLVDGEKQARAREQLSLEMPGGEPSEPDAQESPLEDQKGMVDEAGEILATGPNDGTEGPEESDQAS